MQRLSKVFFRGLFTLLPLGLTLYIVYQALTILENFLGGILRSFMGTTYIPGLGFLGALGIIFAFGLMLSNYITQRFFKSIENYLNQIPFVKAIYSPLRDLMNLFSKRGDGQMKAVVMIKVGDANLVGLVTRDNFSDLPLGKAGEGKIAVYVPFSYALGGYTFLVPKSSVTEVDIPIEKAMSLAITGWVKTESENQNPSSKI
jgi:uncharacterized membrane protein